MDYIRIEAALERALEGQESKSLRRQYLQTFMSELRIYMVELNEYSNGTYIC